VEVLNADTDDSGLNDEGSMNRSERCRSIWPPPTARPPWRGDEWNDEHGLDVGKGLARPSERRWTKGDVTRIGGFSLSGLFHTVLKLTVVLGLVIVALRLADEPVVTDRPFLEPADP
jgi:hypothetical protein